MKWSSRVRSSWSHLFYPDNHGGKTVPVTSKPDFSLDFDAIGAAINSQTAAVLVNSPNNPTGKVYSAEDIEGLGALLQRKSKEIGRTIVLISDEPYRGIVYDGVEVPSILKAYPHSIVATSFSKDLSLPG